MMTMTMVSGDPILRGEREHTGRPRCGGTGAAVPLANTEFHSAAIIAR